MRRCARTRCCRRCQRTFPSRLFSPLSRLRERGGGEGRRIHEVGRINPCALTSPRNSAVRYRLPSFT
ncbi:hypothetical protein CBM2634_B180032 [Cupriavidus taiwanensis]|uniref:Uncharacterized protein n=1 Tax=Cupriavidus taiwanensis TaxID=164546 RepID=A0A375JC86_9BURK|nr:hypothetical protein CBM2634_B180032 [Cupriavidus taiwanensis]